METSFSQGPSPVSFPGCCSVLKAEISRAIGYLFSCPGSSSVFWKLSMPHPLTYGSVVFVRETSPNYSGSYQPHLSLNWGFRSSIPACLGLVSPSLLPLASVTKAYTGKPLGGDAPRGCLLHVPSLGQGRSCFSQGHCQASHCH